MIPPSCSFYTCEQLGQYHCERVAQLAHAQAGTTVFTVVCWVLVTLFFMRLFKRSVVFGAVRDAQRRKNQYSFDDGDGDGDGDDGAE